MTDEELAEALEHEWTDPPRATLRLAARRLREMDAENDELSSTLAKTEQVLRDERQDHAEALQRADEATTRAASERARGFKEGVETCIAMAEHPTPPGSEQAVILRRLRAALLGKEGT